MKVLSFGGGVQTVTMAVLACKGKLPMPDVAIFADPQWESKSTYKYIESFKPYMQTHGMKFVTATRGNIKDDYVNAKRWPSMPLFTRDVNGKKGMLRRQCTNDYKISVVFKEVRKQLGLVKYQRVKVPVDMWLGISTDEATRMKPSRIKWATNIYPLIELGMSREDCLSYLKDNGIAIPPKSACIGCPYHSDDFWKNLKLNSPDEFEESCLFDDQLRLSPRKGLDSQSFLHRSTKPLREVVFSNGKQDAFQNECEGHCGL